MLQLLLLFFIFVVLLLSSMSSFLMSLLLLRLRSLVVDLVADEISRNKWMVPRVTRDQDRTQ